MRCDKVAAGRMLPRLWLVILWSAVGPVPGAVADSWREPRWRATLQTGSIEVTLQAGLPCLIRNRATGATLISREPADLPSRVFVFGNEPLSLDEARVRGSARGDRARVQYEWPDGTVWSLTWEAEASGDVVLRASGRRPSPCGYLRLPLDGCNIRDFALVTVSNFGVGQEVRAPYDLPFEKALPQAPGDLSGALVDYHDLYVQPLIALFEGQEGGFVLEGRFPDVGPANLRVYGYGDTAQLVFIRGFPEPTRKPELYEVRLRAYQGPWQRAVDPHIAWMEHGLGMVPLARRDPSWVRDIHAQTYVDPREGVGGLPVLEQMAGRLDPRKTLLGKESEYRPIPEYGFDHGYPDYTPTAEAVRFFRRARELGFHVAAHVNAFGIDLRFTELLQRFRPGLHQTGTDAEGKPIWFGYTGTWSNAYGPVRFAWCSPAYAPWRRYLVERLRPLVEAGVDVIYLDECHTPLGAFVVAGQTAIQGVMDLQRDILRAYPGVAIMTEQFNPMNARHASFALTSHAPGHPLGGYLFHRFLRVSLWYGLYQASDPARLDALEQWGFFTPGASTDERWLAIARAFQDGDLEPAPLQPREPWQLSAFAGRDGTRAWFEKRDTSRGLVVSEPGKAPRWVGRMIFNTDRWPGPGGPPGWLLYDGDTVLGLDPARAYVFDDTVRPDPGAFHLRELPPGFVLVSQETSLPGPIQVVRFRGEGTVRMRVPETVTALYADGEAVPVDRAAKAAVAQLAAEPAEHAIIALGAVPDLAEARLLDLTWFVPGSGARQSSSYVVPNQAEGWMVHNGRRLWVAGRLPAGEGLALVEEFSQRAVSGSPGQGTVRINGAVAWQSPVTKQESPCFAFDILLGPWSGQPVLIELAVEGQAEGFSAGDFYAPRLLARPPAAAGNPPAPF